MMTAPPTEAQAPTPEPGDRDEYTSDKLVAGHFDFLDAKADQWMAETSVRMMANAMASVFEKYASQEIMDRFREKLGGMMHQCFVEGALRAWLDISAQGGLVRVVKGDNDAREAFLMTDDAKMYRLIGREFAGHAIVKHTKGEYGRGELHTNTIEGSFSIFKRGMKGVYQHCAEKHLHRYLAEFEFRYCNREATGFNDRARSVQAIKGIVGKRLTYRRHDWE